VEERHHVLRVNHFARQHDTVSNEHLAAIAIRSAPSKIVEALRKPQAPVERMHELYFLIGTTEDDADKLVARYLSTGVNAWLDPLQPHPQLRSIPASQISARPMDVPTKASADASAGARTAGVPRADLRLDHRKTVLLPSTFRKS
jgi:hypothetical protein